MKFAVENNAKGLGKMIEKLICGTDVTSSCFEECLELAVKGNRHFAAGFIILRGPDNTKKCLHLALTRSHCIESAAMLLLCIACRHGDEELVDYLFNQDDDGDQTRRLMMDCYSLKHIPQKVLDAEKMRRLK